MLIAEKIEVYGLASAMRGMRNPLNSWEKSDSIRLPKGVCNMMCPISEVSDLDMDCNMCHAGVLIGKNDMQLAQSLVKAGSSHRKFMRQIFVSVDITAPQYWWSEFDTYKVGTCANSCSKMHTLLQKPFTLMDFSIDQGFDPFTPNIGVQIQKLNEMRDYYMAAKNAGADPVELKQIWRSILQQLPMSFNQKRTVTMTYENLLAIREQRAGHKLSEWQQFIDWTDKLPYLKEFTDGI